MTAFTTLLQQGNAWLFIPSAILLGALHGLEPGHSKTMMAAFIVAIRGTLAQAVLLGLSATLSHTVIVWIIAMAGLYFGRNWGDGNAQAYEPYFQLASGILIIGVAGWMLWRVNQEHREHHQHQAHHGHHGHDHEHHDHHHDEPAEITDAHERAHARDIQRRFAGRDVTTGQIILFGLTGGLIPCPASITVLLICLQLKKIALGATLVLCFSIGLAITMVASGALAALSVRHVSGQLSRRWNGFGTLASKVPYLSGVLICLVGLYVIYQGMTAIALGS